MLRRQVIGNHDETGLSIGDLAARTGVSPGTLRTWEARYGVPAPDRVASGHRRYAERDVGLVQEVLRQRGSGLSMPVAVDRARHHLGRLETSLFAGLRRRHPSLRVQLLDRPVLVALSRAMEDECCAEADDALLFGSFQRTRYYAPSRARWAVLARSARSAVVFADFGSTPAPPADGTPLEIPVPAGAPLDREWAVVCDSAERPACLVGWERPGGRGQRLFETFWSLDPAVVRDAARLSARLSEHYRPETRFPGWADLAGSPMAASSQTLRASAVLDRMLGYLSTVDGGAPGARRT
jgi:MerR family transcriptional regulator, light-induced transcriptional regulator